MMKAILERWLLNVWYGDGWLGRYVLLPLTALFCLLGAIHRWYQKRHQVRHPVPVVVVGNIAIGGTGKTPLVIWLVERLREMGFQPGVVSRGFGGHTAAKGECRVVSAHDSAIDVGDEPLLIFQRTNVPLVIGRNRNQAITTLLQQYPCDVIIADDGLQHYAMGRDVEICVVDGQRRFGNGFCLPSGALRERVSRLQRCDFVLTNGEDFKVRGEMLVNLASGATQTLQAMAGQVVHVVTGIGNPQRFINLLETAGLQVLPHIYPDHHAFQGNEWQFEDGLSVLMTEKDAVKCRPFAPQNAWYLPVNAVLEAAAAHALLTRLRGLRDG